MCPRKAVITNYYTLHALAHAWRADLAGCLVGDAFSQAPDELTLALAAPEREWMLRARTQAPDRFVFRAEGYSRARRNVASLFEDALDRRIEGVRLAERDRMLYLDLDGGLAFQVMLFGPRANVFLVAEGQIVEAFQADAALAGTEAPAPRPAPYVDTFEAFETRWRSGRKTLGQAVAAALPLFDRTLAAEVVHRAGVAQKPPAEASEADRHALFEAAGAVRRELEAPTPRIYWSGRFADAFSLVELRHRPDAGEVFETVDEAVRLYARRRLAERHFRLLYEPLEKALAEATDHRRRSSERMLDELSKESRADRYERWGHLLMAAPHEVPPGAEEAALPDLFEPGQGVTIPLDPALSAVENAQRYYDRARRTRQAREHAEERLVEVEAQADAAKALLTELQTAETVRDVERFRKEHADALAPFTSEQATGVDRVPFRRYDLGDGYEVWVGRNAKQNDALTLRHAQKYDLWMHARGVAGSHAVLRLPGRDSQPPRSVLERAAAIAAYHSKAQGSALVPVTITPRKYVRKPKGAAPGAVLLEREDVLLVEPKLP